MRHTRYHSWLSPEIAAAIWNTREGAFMAFVLVCALVLGAGAPINQALASDTEAARLGQRVFAVQSALDDPAAPGALQAVTDLGLDSRYYVMVRGWLGLQLEGDRSIVESSQNDVSPEIERRIEFLEQAIRAIDLE